MTASNFYVYVHNRLKNGEPFYVGKGRGKRCGAHQKRNPHWRNIVAKDGGFHISFIARNIDEQSAFIVEMETIDKYRSSGVNLANMTDGGEGISGFRHTDEARAKMSAKRKARITSAETRAKMSAALIGNKRRLGIPHSAETKAKYKLRVVSDETRRKMSEIRTGRKGIPMTDEHKKKLLACHVGIPSPMRGRSVSQETRKKMGESHRKPVLCVDTGEVFDCALSAAQRFGYNYCTLIGLCCRGLRKSAHGHVFEYVRRMEVVGEVYAT